MGISSTYYTKVLCSEATTLSNDQVIARAGVEDISETLRRERAKLLGHVLRSSQHDIMASTALDAAVRPRPLTGKRRRGAPRVHWVQMAASEALRRLPHSAQTRTGVRRMIQEDEAFRGRVTLPLAEPSPTHSPTHSDAQSFNGMDAELIEQLEIEEDQGFHRGSPSQDCPRVGLSFPQQPALPPDTQALAPPEPRPPSRQPPSQPPQAAEGALDQVTPRDHVFPHPGPLPQAEETQGWVLKIPGDLLILRELAHSRPLWHKFLTGKAAHSHSLCTE